MPELESLREWDPGTYIFVLIVLKNFLVWKFSNIYKSTETNIINYLVSISQLQQFMANLISSTSLLPLFLLDNFETNPIYHLASFVMRLNVVT